MLHFVRRASLALSTVALTVTPLLAQGTGTTTSNDSSTSPQASELRSPPTGAAQSLAPRSDALVAGVRPVAVNPAPPPVPAPLPGAGDTSQNRALMIVGGAALVVGAIIGGRAGTIVMVGGAVVGLYGLYKFLL